MTTSAIYVAIVSHWAPEDWGVGEQDYIGAYRTKQQAEAAGSKAARKPKYKDRGTSVDVQRVNLYEGLTSIDTSDIL